MEEVSLQAIRFDSGIRKMKMLLPRFRGVSDPGNKLTL
jgi:hypothetical protein